MNKNAIHKNFTGITFNRVVLHLVFLILIVPFQLYGQDVEKPRANYKLAMKFTTDNVNDLIHDTRINATWLEDLDQFWYRFKNDDGTAFYLVDPARRTKEPVFDNAVLAAELSQFLHKPYDPKQNPVTTIKFVKNNSAVEFEVDSIKFEYTIVTKSVTFLDSIKSKPEDNAGNWRSYNSDSTYVAFARNHNLFVMQADDPDSTEYQLTTDGERWYSYARDDGDTSKTERIRSRNVWFTDSDKMYVSRQDRRKVGDLWVINEIDDPRPTLETYKYPMPGEDNVPQYELWFFDADDKSSVKADADKWIDQAIGGTYVGGGGIFRGKTDDKLYFVRRSRDWKDIELCVTDTETGEVKVLISERSEPYYNVRYIQLSIINDGNELLWWSDRDGWGHFYLYDSEGNQKSRLTSGPFMAERVTKIDTTGRVLYFTAVGREEGEDPYYTHNYRVNFDGTGMQLLNPESGVHSARFSQSNNYFVDNYSRIDMVPKAVVRDNKGNPLMELEEIDISRLEEAGWKMPEPFKVKAADGITDIYGVMWKPFDFDPEKQYPIIAHVYPGPQTESVPKTFSATNRNVSLSQLGFVVIAVGSRGGSPQRNSAYHTYGYWNARDYALADKKAAIEQLASRHSFIDIERVGIYGHSGGGFLSTAAMVVPPYNDFFKVAVSSAGNHDNNIYNIWWGENHFGVKMVKKPKSSGNEIDSVGTEGGGGRDGRGAASQSTDTGDDDEAEFEIVWETNIDTNPEMAENLKGRLLLVHGSIDNNVHPANTTRMVNALIKANKRFDYMILPGRRHGFGPMNDYFVRMLWDYFAEHLIGDSNKNVDIFEIDKKK